MCVAFRAAEISDNGTLSHLWKLLIMCALLQFTNLTLEKLEENFRSLIGAKRVCVAIARKLIACVTGSVN